MTETAIFASGCFWGTEYHFSKASGVLKTVVGYCGGATSHPTYEEVKSGSTGHLECVKVDFDPQKTTYERLLQLFFETHDFTQTNGQGPDIGSQYLSAIFALHPEQEKTANRVISWLRQQKYEVATAVRPAETFYPAEDYHQNYYLQRGSSPYCHVYRKIF